MVGFVHFPMGTLTPKIAVSGKLTFAQKMFLAQFLVAGTAVHGRLVVKSFVFFFFGQRVAAQVLGKKTTSAAFATIGRLVGGGLFAFPSSFVGHVFLHARPNNPFLVAPQKSETSGDGRVERTSETFGPCSFG